MQLISFYLKWNIFLNPLVTAVSYYASRWARVVAYSTHFRTSVEAIAVNAASTITLHYYIESSVFVCYGHYIAALTHSRTP